MKTVLLLLLLNTSFRYAEKVYVCRSSTSFAYHKKWCQGLSNCSHRIDTITVKEAVEAGYKKPCGYCYR